MIWGKAQDVLWLNGEDVQTRLLLEDVDMGKLATMLSGRKTMIVDEAQNVLNIGLQLKRIVDSMPDLQIIATGSSSFDLANKVKEPMTGRKFELRMFPLCHAEMVRHHGAYEERLQLGHRMTYGSYPEVVSSPGMERELLTNLTTSYLYKDILMWEHIKKSERLTKLLQALALQIGFHVSYSELGDLCGLDNKTVEKYVALLEQSFIIFRLPSFARNLRNELKFARKIYFWDLGIRNALIGNFSPLDVRADVGQLWENYIISERMKKNAYAGFYGHHYFWRNQQQAEIDLVEESDGKLSAYEFKWSGKRNVKAPSNFISNYEVATFAVVTPDNYEDFLSI